MTEEPRVSEEEKREIFDALGTLGRVLARLLAVVSRIAFRVSIVLFTWLVAGFREMLYGEKREDWGYWLLLAGERWHITAGIIGAVFLGTMVLGSVNIIGVRQSAFVTTMFSTIIAGLFSFVPIVIGVNQLALSWLSGTPDTLRSRIESVEQFRTKVEEMAAEVDVASTDPVSFTETLLSVIEQRADAVVTAEEDAPEVERYAAGIRDRVSALADTIEPGDTMFDVLLPLLDEEYSKQVAKGRRLRSTNEEHLAAGTSEALDELDEALVTLDVARQYFKTLHIQSTLASLSRQLAYTGTVGLVLATLVVMIYANGFPAIQSKVPLMLLVSVSLAGAFAPFAVLFAHVVRLATVIQRTAAPGAFVPASEQPL